MKKLTRKGFVAWLRSKKPRARVGSGNPTRRYQAAFCPLRTYLGEDYTVRRLHYRHKFGGYRPMPKWAGAFVLAVDNAVDYNWGRVTARRALALLGEEPGNA